MCWRHSLAKPTVRTQDGTRCLPTSRMQSSQRSRSASDRPFPLCAWWGHSGHCWLAAAPGYEVDTGWLDRFHLAHQVPTQIDEMLHAASPQKCVADDVAVIGAETGFDREQIFASRIIL